MKGEVYNDLLYQSIEEFKDDSKAFIFTLKNAYRIEPTRYLKKKESEYAIKCDSRYGPTFGSIQNEELFINNNCNEKRSCFINNDGTNAYEYHPEYKSSLFVNTAGPDEENYFSVLDYEVYTHNESSY